MLILNSISTALRSLLSVVITPRCAACREPLTAGQRGLCTKCRLDMPLTNYSRLTANKIAVRVKSIRPEVSNATALMYYSKGYWRDMIHRFKYGGEWRSALLMGEIMGDELSQSPLYADIDLIIPIPLHPFRQLWRGYNQSYYIARGIAKRMGVESTTRGIRRIRHNSPQARSKRSERWANVESIFEVSDSKVFENRNILIVDDLFTTGATMMSCAEEILNQVPTATISIATLAVSQSDAGLD